jgi:hypothetical protein
MAFSSPTIFSVGSVDQIVLLALSPEELFLHAVKSNELHINTIMY